MASNAQINISVYGSMGVNPNIVQAIKDPAQAWASLPGSTQTVQASQGSGLPSGAVGDASLLGGTVAHPAMAVIQGDPTSAGCPSNEPDANGNPVPVLFCTRYAADPVTHQITNAITVISSQPGPDGTPYSQDPAYLQEIMAHEDVHGMFGMKDCDSGSACATSASNNSITPGFSPDGPEACDGVGVEDASNGAEGENSSCVCNNPCDSTCTNYNPDDESCQDDICNQNACNADYCPGWDCSCDDSCGDGDDGDGDGDGDGGGDGDGDGCDYICDGMCY